MSNTKNAQVNYVGPFITMVVLFFFVGFLTVVNQQFQGPLQHALLSGAEQIKNTLSVLVTFSFFLAYPLTGGLGARWVDKHGYKKTLVRALLVLVAGLGVFELSVLQHAKFPTFISFGENSVPVGFFIFLVGSYVVGAALTILQVVINPYLVACSVKGTTGVQRQMMGGASNSTGTTIAPFFVSGIIFGGLTTEQIKVDQLIVPFIGLMIVIAIVAFVVNRLTLPNIQGTTNETGEKLEKSIWSFSHLKLGVIGIFFYVGIEVAIGANIKLYAESLQELLGTNFTFFGSEKLNIFGVDFAIPAFMASLYWFGMLVGRLISSTLNKVSANAQLIFTSVVATLLVVISMVTGNPWFLVFAGLCHSVMWSGIFTLAIEKLGKYTSKGSGALMIGVLGGGVLPLLQGMMADAMGGDWKWTWAIVIIGEVYVLYYALVGYKVKQSA